MTAPLLLELLFPETAESVLPVAAPRLLQWSSAFDAWRDERRMRRPPWDRAFVIRTWRNWLGECGKPPWEISQADIQQHIDRMKANGFAATTIHHAVTCISAFYRWRAEQQPDPECPPSFNPAAGVDFPKSPRYSQSPLFSRGELEALLGYMQRDTSALGRRDYAFVLARLGLGVPLRRLQRLRWEQLECDASFSDDGGAWLRLRPGDTRLPLPADAWQAIRLWLEQTGRLPLMQPGDYIFTPLADPLHEADADRPQAWTPGRFICTSQCLRNLRLYGRRLGLPEEKLNWISLRQTAVRLRLEAGDSPGALRAFLDRQTEMSRMPAYLKAVPELPPSSAPEGPVQAQLPELPNRKPYVYQPWCNITHGLEAAQLPPEQLSERAG